MYFAFISPTVFKLKETLLASTASVSQTFELVDSSLASLDTDEEDNDEDDEDDEDDEKGNERNSGFPVSKF